jgi:hypothetical protein
LSPAKEVTLKSRIIVAIAILALIVIPYAVFVLFALPAAGKPV